MLISELIDLLTRTKKRLGDVDVVYVTQNQFEDVTGLDAINRGNCPPDLTWCMSGPVAVLRLAGSPDRTEAGGTTPDAAQPGPAGPFAISPE